jgi:hypothetical protein
VLPGIALALCFTNATTVAVSLAVVLGWKGCPYAVELRRLSFLPA